MRLVRPYIATIVASFAFAFLLAPGDGRAEGLLDFLFGSDPEPARPAQHAAPTRRAPPTQKKAVGELRFAKPGEGGPGQAEQSTGGYCVRTCDGYYFPLIKSARATRQQSCEFACPSAPMEIYDGSSIETARNYKGQRYTALPTAFAFRDKASTNCSCNDPQSSQAFFLQMSRNDPTLRSGDVVVEDSGAFVYSGSSLVPLSHASFMPSQIRQRLRTMLRRYPSSGGAPLREASTHPEAQLEISKDDRTGSTTR